MQIIKKNATLGSFLEKKDYLQSVWTTKGSKSRQQQAAPAYTRGAGDGGPGQRRGRSWDVRLGDCGALRV